MQTEEMEDSVNTTPPHSQHIAMTHVSTYNQNRQALQGVDVQYPQDVDAQDPEKADPQGPQNVDVQDPPNADAQDPPNADAQDPQNVDAQEPPNADAQDPQNVDAQGPEDEEVQGPQYVEPIVHQDIFPQHPAANQHPARSFPSQQSSFSQEFNRQGLIAGSSQGPYTTGLQACYPEGPHPTFQTGSSEGPYHTDVQASFTDVRYRTDVHTGFPQAPYSPGLQAGYSGGPYPTPQTDSPQAPFPPGLQAGYSGGPYLTPQTDSSEGPYPPGFQAGYPEGAYPTYQGPHAHYPTREFEDSHYMYHDDDTVLVDDDENEGHDYYVFSCMVLWCCNPMFGAIALILSHLSRKAWKKSKRALAKKYGIGALVFNICGIVCTVLVVAFVIFYLHVIHRHQTK